VRIMVGFVRIMEGRDCYFFNMKKKKKARGREKNKKKNKKARGKTELSSFILLIFFNGMSVNNSVKKY
jgi:hypothetical protein